MHSRVSNQPQPNALDLKSQMQIKYKEYIYTYIYSQWKPPRSELFTHCLAKILGHKKYTNIFSSLFSCAPCTHACWCACVCVCVCSCGGGNTRDTFFTDRFYISTIRESYVSLELFRSCFRLNSGLGQIFSKSRERTKCLFWRLWKRERKDNNNVIGIQTNCKSMGYKKL